jgi:RecJ-like exonuclease
MQADHSSFRCSDDAHEPIAIDFVMRMTERPSIEKYEELVNSPAQLELNYRKATILLERAVERAQQETKVKQRGELTYYLTDLSFLPKGGYPSKGKVINAIAHEHADEECVCLGYGDTTILFRVSAKAHEKGYKANEIIAGLKREFSGDIYSGGGHECAASTRFKAGSANKILNRIQTL